MATQSSNFNLTKPEVNDGIETTITSLANNFQTIDTELHQTQTEVDILNNLVINPMTFGAKLDGVTDDTVAMREAIAFAESIKGTVMLTGVAVITGELEIKQPLTIMGVGTGGGYADTTLTNYKQTSGFLVKGTGTKRLRTRRKYRATATDPADELLSVALNVQAENVTIKNLSVFLDFDETDATPTNYGADWDCGIFVGSRTHFIADNVHVLGYFRKAGFYYDVTHATNLPRFNDLDGNPYQNDFNISGGDGCAMIKCYVRGAKWGVFVAGGIRKAGITVNDTKPDFYDELTGTTDTDFRGSFGFSDFTMYSCSIYGTDHHSNYRRDDATGDYLTDTAGGAMYVDGMAANASGAVWGMRFFSTRFATFEPYRVRLEQAARATFVGCHIEQRSGSSRKTTSGGTINFDDTDTYGFITCTDRSDHIGVFAGNLPSLRPNTTFIPSTVRIHNYMPSGTSTGTSTTDPIVASRFEAISGELDLRSATTSDPIRFRNGASSLALLSSLGLEFQGNITNPRITSGAGELDLRSAGTTDSVRIRRGSSTTALFNETNTSLSGEVRPFSTNAQDLGSGNFQWRKGFLNNIVLAPITSAEASNNSIFVDSADGLPKFKNSSGTVTAL